MEKGPLQKQQPEFYMPFFGYSFNRLPAKGSMLPERLLGVFRVGEGAGQGV